MFNIFKDKFKKARKNNKKATGVSTAKVSITKVNRVEPERAKPKTVEPVKPWYEMQYRNNSTGEVHTFDSRDSEVFDDIMSRKDVTLIFG